MTLNYFLAHTKNSVCVIDSNDSNYCNDCNASSDCNASNAISDCSLTLQWENGSLIPAGIAVGKLLMRRSAPLPLLQVQVLTGTPGSTAQVLPGREDQGCLQDRPAGGDPGHQGLHTDAGQAAPGHPHNLNTSMFNLMMPKSRLYLK